MDDLGRLPRYGAFLLLGLAAVWGPIAANLVTAPLRFTSEASLILPGSGAGASVNLDRIGQASSAAASPFANSSVSPTATYQRPLGAGRILDAAAAQMGMARSDFSEPRIRLIDQTGLIRIEMTGNSAEDARARALLAAFTAAVTARAAEAEACVAGLIDAAAELEGLQRDHAVAEAVFALAMARADTSRTDLFVSYPLVQVLENPSLPDHPSSPRRKLALAAGGAGSLCLLIGLGMGWQRRPLIDRLLARPA